MSVTVLKPQNERDMLRSQLSKMGGEFRMALPSHISPDKFQRVVMTAVQQNPDLMIADRRSLLMAATKCATDGLLPDNREAAFVIFNTKVKDEWVKLVQYMPMRAGIQKRAMNSGHITSLQGHVIYENDHFIWRQGTKEELEHVPLFPGDRGKAIGAYAIARIKGQADPIFRVMDHARIEKARAVSKSKSGPAWTQWWEEMAIKTVIRNLAKDLPSEAEIEGVARRDDDAPAPDDSTETIDAVLTDDQRQLPGKLDAIERTIDGAAGSDDDIFPGDR